MKEISRERILERANRLPSLSVVVQHILASINNPTSSAMSLALQIGRDPAITSRVLRVANSAFYGHSERVNSISDAVVILGLDTVRSVALSATMLQWIKKTGAPLNLDAQSFWRYLVGTASCAQLIATSCGVEREPAFIASLLHAVGRFLLDTQFPLSYAEVIGLAKQTDVELSTVEKEVLGFDSATVGFMILRAWRFPEAIRNAVRDHISPPEPVNAVSAVTHVAYVLSHALEFGNSGCDKVPALAEAAWDKLDLSMEKLEALLPQMQAQYVCITQMLGEAS